MIEIRFNDAECLGTGCDDWTHSDDCPLYEAYIDGPDLPIDIGDDDADSV